MTSEASTVGPDSLRPFSPDRIRRIYDRNAPHPEVLNKVIAMHVEEISTCLAAFNRAYGDFLQRINDLVNREALQEAVDATALLGLLSDWVTAAQERKLVYDKVMLLRAKHEVERLIRERASA